MDDSCAVCAENLEWVAYGSCGHREVCSTCVARLRFICGDRRCCICKAEATAVFVTKAMGDYTRMINDFSIFPSEVREGRMGSYWYHEDTEAFFDDPDHYKMIKAMCRLSCSVCDKVEDQSSEGPKRRAKFRNIEQLKGHLFHRHRLLMCSLCLEGRKVFISEQKLYTRAQLNQHISSGDSEVDGSESERGGFTGHPTCEFCRTPFYGDNELYSHMSTEHYTCHICQRQHPGQFEYYKNYDDLEIHFRRDHLLCEDESCLAKKFVVFQSEAELKRHNAIEHGGRMSRAKRNAALQIPTSFRYRRAAEENRRGRGRSFQREPSDYQLSAAIQASLETAMDPLPSTSNSQMIPDHEEVDIADPLVQPFEELSTRDSESSSRYLQALGPNSRGSALGESSFPPLPMAPSSSQSKPKNKNPIVARGSALGESYFPPLPLVPSSSQPKSKNKNPIVAQSWGQNSKSKNSPSDGQSWPSPSRRSVQPSASAVQSGPAVNSEVLTSQNLISTAPPSYASSAQVWPWSQHQPVTTDGSVSSSTAKTFGKKSRIKHSASDPSLAETDLAESSSSDFPPISATQVRKLPVSNQASVKVEDVQTANKSLVEKIRSALAHDEEKYAAFKELSGQYRQGLIDTQKYLDYVRQHRLSHLVIELASLLPDPQKQQELVETYNSSLRNNVQENGGVSNFRLKDINGSRKAKGKSPAGSLNPKDVLADNILSSVRKLQSDYKHSEEEVEVLSKDGYRGSKGKSKLTVDEQPIEIRSGGQALERLGLQNDTQTIGNGSGDGVSGVGGGSSKQRKKTSKFHRARLGDGSMAALLDLKNTEPDPDPELEDKKSNDDQNSMAQLPVRGAWRKGGQKLFP